MAQCGCGIEHYVVMHRKHNHSSWGYPKGGPHKSAYSGIKCMACGAEFRSKAKWVDRCPDFVAFRPPKPLF